MRLFHLSKLLIVLGSLSPLLLSAAQAQNSAANNNQEIARGEHGRYAPPSGENRQRVDSVNRHWDRHNGQPYWDDRAHQNWNRQRYWDGSRYYYYDDGGNIIYYPDSYPNQDQQYPDAYQNPNNYQTQQQPSQANPGDPTYQDMINRNPNYQPYYRN